MISSEDHDSKRWSLPWTIGGIMFLGFGLILMLTNPSKSKYEEFATQELVNYLRTNICQANSQQLQEALKSQMCNLMLDTGEKQIPKLITKTTERHNYLLLSVYETNLFVYNVETIGIFNNFYIIGVDKIYHE
jgi:hypothetical protein